MKMENLYKVPGHVSIIMDGNGRWARRRGLPRYEGHREGAKALEKVLKASTDLGINWLSVFAFSTENWKRPKEEIEVIMSLLIEYINTKLDDLNRLNIRLRFMGNREKLSKNLIENIERGERETEKNTGLNFIVALNYSGKMEIIDAVNKILKSGKSEITEEDFKNYLYIPEMPEPDLLIRTSGEYRISNYMLWELAYTELYFTDVLWPDFDEREFLKALYSYQSRERRFGKVL